MKKLFELFITYRRRMKYNRLAEKLVFVLIKDGDVPVQSIPVAVNELISCIYPQFIYHDSEDKPNNWPL
jgi:hypothetical protein